MFANIFPLQLDFVQFEVPRLPYSEESLRTYRASHNRTHSFFKNGKYIYVSNKTGDDLEGTEPYRFDIYQEPEITLSLIRHIFFKTFLKQFKNRVPVSFHPFRFLSSRNEDDWIKPLLPPDLQGKLAYTKQIELQFRLVELLGKKQFVLVVNIERKWQFNLNGAELISRGFDPTGSEVIHAEPFAGLQNILAPNEEFVGKVIKVSGENVEIDTPLEKKTLPLHEIFLRKTNSNIKTFLTQTHGAALADKVLAKIKTDNKENLRHKAVWEEIKKIADSFIWTIPKLADEKLLYRNKDGFCFTIDEKAVNFGNSIELKNPTFIFDQPGVKTNTVSPDAGLSNFGPYDSNIFDTKSPTIFAICHKNNRGRFTNFLKELFDGIPDSKYFTKGLKGKFELHQVNFQIAEIGAYTEVEYKKAFLILLVDKPDLILLELSDEVKVSDPLLYYRLKAMMLTRQIPVQAVLSSKLLNYNEFILNSLALQLYAKLGGVPWVLKSSMSVDREIIIGIGHSILRKGSQAGLNQDRVVGITTFFSSDGQYLLSNKAKDVDYENYFDELLKSLKGSLDELQKTNNWKRGDTIRLIFHIFKQIKNVEFEVIANLIRSYPEFKIQFAFVTVGKNHPFIMFDPTGGKVVRRYSGEVRIGELVPFRGANLQIDRFTVLIQMLGGKEIKSETHGASNPLQIKIRVPTSTGGFEDLLNLIFTDLGYITQQIFAFTYLSWRNYLPSEHPVTMLYSELVAKQLGKLRKVEGWSPDVLNYTLKTKKWFL